MNQYTVRNYGWIWIKKNQNAKTSRCRKPRSTEAIPKNELTIIII